MSIATLILGASGTGKTASLRNLDPTQCLLIQPVRKPLPFPAKGWAEIRAKGDGNNIYVTDDAAHIVSAMSKTNREIVIVDDWQYVLSFMFMRMRNLKGYDKFTDIGGAGFDIAKAASELGPNKRVYILAHSQTDDFGFTRIKTLGRMLDEKICVEGLFTTVLRTKVDQAKYCLLTHNSGADTVKSPMGLFESDEIENDLALVDTKICQFYEIPQHV